MDSKDEINIYKGDEQNIYDYTFQLLCTSDVLELDAPVSDFTKKVMFDDCTFFAMNSF